MAEINAIIDRLIEAAPSLKANQHALFEVCDLSDFICRVCEQQSEPLAKALVTLFEQRSCESIVSEMLSLERAEFNDLGSLDKALRQVRNRSMALIACADLLKMQKIETSMRLVSQVADKLITLAYLWHYDELSRRYGLPAEQQHMQIMAMGKLGGRELNFSSDIDLIFAYPSNLSSQSDKKPLEHQQFFTRLAQKLISSLDSVSQYGRVFRVDMRLRPLGESGPLVISYAAFEHYLLEQGREWERFALQKARVLNPNRHTSALLDIIRPFVYRKYLDYTTIESIHDMKLLIEQEVRRRQLKHNIKLGKGGIREVEFFVQSLQLINAGRRPTCQTPSLLMAIDALLQEQCLEQEIASNLQSRYLTLRTIEHYLQIFNDEQTQTLPSDERDQTRLSRLLGAPSFQQLMAYIENCMLDINAIFSEFIEPPSSKTQECASVYRDLWLLEWEGNESLDLPDVVSEFDMNSMLIAATRDFKDKLKRTSMPAKASKSLNYLMPIVIEELAESACLTESQFKARTNGIFSVIQTVLGRPSYLDLLLQTPDVRKRLGDLCEASPWVAHQFETYPILLDELLHPSYLHPEDLSIEEFKNQCVSELRQHLLRVPEEDIEQQMDSLRLFKNAHQIRVAAADISDTLPINRVSDRLTVLAEVLLAEIVEQAWRHCVEKYGSPSTDHEKQLTIVAYGKFGGWELSYGSDLDIVFLYDAPSDEYTDQSGSRDAISKQAFYIKLVQRISHLCTTQTYLGKLYELDLRLRPSGNSGLLVSQISAFADYQNSQAWTWEHQALIRARPVYGSDTLQTRFKEIRRQVLCQKRDPMKLKQEVIDMRDKMREHLDSSNAQVVDIKQCLGGVVDIEFAVQYWGLLYAQEFPDLIAWSDNLRILESLAALGVLSKSDAHALQECYLWLRHQGHTMQLAQQAKQPRSAKLAEICQRVVDISPLL